MRLLIAHLSDLHLRRDDDALLRRAGRVIDALRTADGVPDMIVLALTGDISFSGKDAEYQLATKWLADVRSQLESAVGNKSSIHVAAIPGNHDCDLSMPRPIREAILTEIQRDPANASDPASHGPATVVQDAFFRWRDTVASEHLLPGHGRLFYEYLFFCTNPDLGSVRVRCLNTAWTSANPEPVGTHVYPPGLIPASENGDEFVLTLMHHPLNWLAPMNARDVRARLQRTPGLILTGHEHAYAAITQTDDTGVSVLRIEGATLQGHKEEPSGFNAILVDTERREFRVAANEWARTHFAPRPSMFTEWTSLAMSPVRAGGDYALRGEMREYVRDAGVDLYHPTRGLLHLDDVFVYPDLREIESGNAKNGRTVRGESILELAAVNERLIISGAHESGKTSFAKRLFIDAIGAGLVPVMIRAQQIALRGDNRDERTVLHLFDDQYVAEADAFLSVPRERRVIIVDGFEHADPEISHEILSGLSQLAGRTIVFAHDLSQQVNELVGISRRPERALTTAHFVMLPCGLVRREQLIDRYVSLAAGRDLDRAETLRAEMRQLLDTALGTYFAPPTPIVVISLLQARAFNDQLNLSQSTYGYYYELLVRRSLAEGAIAEEYDVSLGYLTALVGSLYEDGSRRWTESWFLKFHNAFLEAQGLELRFTDVERTLRERNIIALADGSYAFRYEYFYYFFVARYLAERLHTHEGAMEVRRLSGQLTQEANANILVFLSHFSKDDAILTPMLEQAERVFADAPRATLSRDTFETASWSDLVSDAVYEERPIRESREHFLAALDRARGEDEVARKERSADVEAASAMIARILEAFRTMQILGQILRNFPGTLNRQQKLRITNAIYGVSLRTLGSIQELFRSGGEDAARAVVATMRDQHPELSERQLVERALDVLYWYFFIAALGLTQRTAANVGSLRLAPIFDEIERTDPLVAIRLISIAIKLQRHGFPEREVLALGEEFQRNPLALRILNALVVTHLHLFDVPRDVKLRVCSKLGISIRPQSAQLRGHTQLISAKSSD